MVADPTRASAWRLAVRTWRLLAVLAASAALVGGLTAGAPAAWSAVVGVALAAVLFGLSVLLLVWIVSRPSDASLGLLVGGLGIRLAAYLVILDAASGATWFHAEALAVAVAIALAVTMVAEFVWLTRSPQLFNVDPDARRLPTVSAATRS
ncbi:hypothetical protein [Egicoccus halophilus]|uniref:ATP synthase protein I n=1 Tax=Egicoccus halophilus TaxID=1670830 RepID=A0A8J3A828_9ACTN|nr:hypothetical protein [Egicoccus halophilus]GGI04029.1 hypothetical protein GCM10011354_07010 [Egicoccus halophilus]